MPHYRDGTPARAGDIVKGVPYNTGGREVVGVLTYFNPGASACNCRVAFVDEVPFTSDTRQPGPYGVIGALVSTMGEGTDLRRSLLTVKEDAGQCDAFDLIHRAPAPALAEAA